MKLIDILDYETFYPALCMPSQHIYEYYAFNIRRYEHRITCFKRRNLVFYLDNLRVPLVQKITISPRLIVYNVYKQSVYLRIHYVCLLLIFKDIFGLRLV